MFNADFFLSFLKYLLKRQYFILKLSGFNLHLLILPENREAYIVTVAL